MTGDVDADVTRGAIAARVTCAGARWLGRTTSTAAGVLLAAGVGVVILERAARAARAASVRDAERAIGALRFAG